MNPAVKEEWLAALRGDQYKQGRLRLRSSDRSPYRREEGWRFCCLGVLCNIASRHGVGDWESCGNVSFYSCSAVDPHDTSAEILPKAVVAWAGLGGDQEGLHPVVDQLVSLNDGGEPFSIIADLIEERL